MALEQEINELILDPTACFFPTGNKLKNNEWKLRIIFNPWELLPTAKFPAPLQCYFIQYYFIFLTKGHFQHRV